MVVNKIGHADSVASRRRMRACFAVAAVLAFVVGSHAFEACSSEDVLASSGEAIGAAFVADAQGQFSSDALIDQLDEKSGASTVDGDAIVRAGNGELAVPLDAHELRATSDGAVVGYVLSADASTAFSRADAAMRQAGWTGYALGGIAGATYRKADGALHWALLSCTQVGDATSVVICTDVSV